MALKHYLSYLQNTITNKWSDLAMKDLDGATQYTYGELAAQIARLHTTFRLLGIKEGDKIALCGRNCSNWGVTFLAVETYKAVAVSILPDFTGWNYIELLRFSLENDINIHIIFIPILYPSNHVISQSVLPGEAMLKNSNPITIYLSKEI